MLRPPATLPASCLAFAMFQRSLLLLEAFSPLRKNATPLGFPVSCQQEVVRGCSITTSAHLPRTSMLEVEEKFAWTGTNVCEIEERLIQAGFVKASSFEMVDWYFDTTQPYSLTLRDCWLRYRETTSTKDEKGTSDGCWQLKRGTSSTPSGSRQLRQQRTTVYDETEGIEAVMLACSIVKEIMDSQPSSPSMSSTIDASARRAAVFEGYEVPSLPLVTSAPDLMPVARIATRRCRWQVASDSEHPFAALGVDLDTTDFGHAVGEVEMVVESEDQVAEARELIRRFLDQVVYSNARLELQRPAQGKLEFYLERYRPDLYQALIKAGVMK